MYEELDNNTFGIIVDIKGDIGNILLMLNNPCMKKDLINSTMDPNSFSVIRTEFKKGCVKLSLESEDSVFCVNLPKKIYLYDKTVKLITGPEGGYLSEVVLAFQGMDKLDEVKETIKDIHGLTVIDLVPTVYAFNGFDVMMESFKKKKFQDQSLITL